ncbi:MULTISPECIES: AAA family ATPase [unclassified Mesorhizobium]|uniref:helix-turn-helix transcriptional regulator n=2 Tax=Mesorhizobium TaxID=68287 RepID=UPI000FCCA4B5|nr:MULTISPECIES: AAA family ATPase [unclassified Mesorhizobium]RUZ30723.1 helix-turn-helix transcriptional regulator [Mesorhizobium sp. M7A.F.Ca.US.007.01.2.1]RUZ46327.1 helix-turn-helix transcriptional regulator [Mesorhizobium sp. M7A.F.Ca.US.003.02.1.1]RUZ66768.1 helix-turn-helix transcriptional regulator [Mesorhizobium sp. M7A.F.Ca.US.007.01.1.1]RUZ92436.1 helix-turn-helix transcriptional regulator [Mesorhizobium sp. M7A.F.Ca.US.003.02.2.1]
MLLERQTQLEQLDGLLAEAARGRGSVVALSGEAGAGKTALVEAFVAGAAKATRILRSACEDLSIPDPLGPLYDLAREAQWAMPQAIDARQGQRLPLFSGALDVFETRTQPTLLVIEDLHWADDATLDFVRFLGRRIANTHILVLLTARTDRSEGQARVRRALGEIPSGNVARIDVPLLSEAAVLSLASAAGRDGDAIYRVTAGNAFFVTELLCADNEMTPPASVRDAVVARAERLSAGARSMLDAVSVFPRRADAWALQGLCGVASAGQLAECVSNGLLDDLGDGYAFRHEIARRAIEMMLTTSYRRLFNQRALSALLENGGVATARLVHHAVEAHNFEAVREFAPIAAREASRVGAHRDAAGYYEVALRQADTLPVEERAGLYEQYAFECHLIARIDEAIKAQEQARALQKALGNTLKEGDSLRWLSRFAYLLGDRPAADLFGAQAVALLEAVPASAELAMAYSNLSQLAMLAERLDETLSLGGRAIELAEQLDRQDVVCHALNNVGAAEQWLDLASSRLHLARSLEIALEQNFQEHAARAFTNCACGEINQLGYSQAQSFLDRGIDYCVDNDLATWRDYMRGVRAQLLLRQGYWNEAAAEALDVISNDQATALVRYPALVALVKLRLRRGDPSAEPLLAEMNRFLERGAELQRLLPYATIVAEQAWLGEAEIAEALRLIDLAETLSPTRAMFAELASWRQILSAGSDAGDTAGMAAPYRMLLAGDWQGAAAVWADLNAPYERALALAQGDEPAQRAALEIFETLGAKPVASHVREIMRRNGVIRIARGPRQTTRANSAGLTQRQMEVLQLIERGFSNKRIAEHLTISPKTVDHHVSAVLGKLDAISRGEATAAARDSGLI